jgi:predicted RecA/RadA family phage recombinase
MANDLIPYKRPGEDVTGIAQAAITGKRCVQITAAKDNPSEGLAADANGNLYKVAHPNGGGNALGAGKRIFGVAKYDAASGGRVGIAREGIVPITTSGAIVAGDEVEVAANGTVVTLAAGTPIGLCCNDAASGADAEIALYEG